MFCLEETNSSKRRWQLNTPYALSLDLVLGVNGQHHTLSKDLGFSACARWTLESGRELIDHGSTRSRPGGLRRPGTGQDLTAPDKC